jgi:hypothetical protein
MRVFSHGIYGTNDINYSSKPLANFTIKGHSELDGRDGESICRVQMVG